MTIAYKVQEHLEDQIVSVIERNREKLQAYDRYPINYTVLKDSYYVLQPKDISKNMGPDPVCENVDFRFMNFQLCPHAKCDHQMEGLRKRTWFIYQADIFIRLLQEIPNAALIDLGANIGYFIVPAMVAMGNRLRAIAVEPMPRNVRSLATALESNKIPRESYAIIKRAIADTADENVTFGIPDDPNWTVGGMDKSKTKYPKSITVLTATFDSHVLPVAKAMNITTAIVKLDVEGAECLSIRGAKKFFAHIHVPYIMIEYHMALTTAECVEEMNRILLEMNYYPYDFYKSGPRDVLNAKNYKNWGYPVFGRKGTRFGDVMWKKIL